MAKSTRSKVKRSFRAKKREEGVYAVTEAARLQRLNIKLRKLTAAEKEADEEADDEMQMEGEKNEVEGAGWSPPLLGSSSSPSRPESLWLMALGLVDPDEITPERLSDLAKLAGSVAASKRRDRSLGGRRVASRGSLKRLLGAPALGVETIGTTGLDHLFQGLLDSPCSDDG
ncbi:hypothetical protein C8Q80DRAFT_1268639 [Daedaleopsis nitida]|nr:hypothetical protein C8Q80DRAFT_1268639 [Daedaleopsis nitida]